MTCSMPYFLIAVLAMGAISQAVNLTATNDTATFGRYFISNTADQELQAPFTSPYMELVCYET